MPLSIDRVLCFAVVAIALGGAVVPAAADSVSDFYKGKRVTFVVGSSAGGGYDANARSLARYMGAFIPGHPDMTVVNMPGAGSISAANHVYAVAPKDGTFIAVVQRPIPFEPLFGNPGVKYDVRKLHWIGSNSAEVGLMVAWHTSPVKTYEDLKKYELIVGGTGAGTDSELYAHAMNNIYGTKFKVVSGYTGSAPVLLAMERGEVQGFANWTWSNIVRDKPDWLKEKKISLLVQLGLKRDPDLPDVPTPLDLARNDREREVWEILLAVKALGRPFFVAAEVPAERVKALQNAFAAVNKDKAFLAEADKQKREVTLVTGPDMENIIKKAYSYPPETVEMTRRAVKPSGSK